MKYQCLNCEKLFVYPAKSSIPVSMNISEDDAIANVVRTGKFVAQQEMHLCPYCGSLDIEEYVLPSEPVAEVANVYIYDLTSGAQTELDGLLAQGYRIVNRYSKQYHLEKPKEAKQP